MEMTKLIKNCKIFDSENLYVAKIIRINSVDYSKIFSVKYSFDTIKDFVIVKKKECGFLLILSGKTLKKAGYGNVYENEFSLTNMVPFNEYFKEFMLSRGKTKIKLSYNEIKKLEESECSKSNNSKENEKSFEEKENKPISF